MKQLACITFLLIFLIGCTNEATKININVTGDMRFMAIDRVVEGEATEETRVFQEQDYIQNVIDRIKQIEVKEIEEKQQTFDQLRQDTVLFFWFTEKDWTKDRKIENDLQPVYFFIVRTDGTFYLADPSEESKQISYVSKEKHPELLKEIQNELDLQF